MNRLGQLIVTIAIAGLFAWTEYDASQERKYYQQVLRNLQEQIAQLNREKEIYWLLPGDVSCSELWKRNNKTMVKDPVTGGWIMAEEIIP